MSASDYTTRAWLPCEHPERPNDAYMIWHVGGCHGCHVAALASMRRWPDDPHVRRVVTLTAPPEAECGTLPCRIVPLEDFTP